MTLDEFITLNTEAVYDLPEEPEWEDFCGCYFVASSYDPYGYREESYEDEDAYDEAMRDWELECERIICDYELSDNLYIFVDGELLEDNADAKAYLDRQIEKAEGLQVWIA